LAFPVTLSNEGTIWKDLDAQLLHDLDSRDIKLIHDAQAQTGGTPQANFQALGWRVLTPTSGNANNPRKYQPAPLCHYDFTVSHLIPIAKKTKNPHVDTLMLFLGKPTSMAEFRTNLNIYTQNLRKRISLRY
jgi:hypothetical protein